MTGGPVHQRIIYAVNDVVTSESPCRERNADTVGEHRVEIGLRNGRSVRVAADIPDIVLHRMIRIAEAS